MLEINENVLQLVGKVQSIDEEIMYEHEKFQKVMIEVKRKSETTDLLPVYIPKKLMYRNEIHVGDNITLDGEIRMANKTENGAHNIYVYGYVTDFCIFDDQYLEVMDTTNYVKLEGYICKTPRYRKTTKTNRYITDLLVANNRKNGKSFYLPCICWGFTAKMASKFVPGDKVCVEGRFQARRYSKLDDNGDRYEYSIQEISATDVHVIEENSDDTDEKIA